MTHTCILFTRFLGGYFLTFNKLDYIYVIKIMILIFGTWVIFSDKFICKGPSTLRFSEIFLLPKQEKDNENLCSAQSYISYRYFKAITFNSINKNSLFKYTFI